MAGTSLSNLYTRKKGKLDYIYVNPNVTREGQRALAEKLYSEIDTEKKLNRMFATRPQLQWAKERSGDQAKAFNDFCVEFIDTSKQTKDNVTDVIVQAQDRIDQLEDIRKHLVEVERQTYRFEMNLPDPYETISRQMYEFENERKEEEDREFEFDYSDSDSK